MAVFLVHDPRCVFIHIPKTGGASIRHGVFGGQVEGPKQGFIPEEWMNYFKFAFVRNPYDRAISAWQMFAQGMENSVWEQPQDKKAITLNEFLSIATDESIPFDGNRTTTERKIRHHAIPQTHEFNCLKFADFVGRFEDLEVDFRHVADEIGLKFENFPHWNRSNRNADFLGYFDEQSKATVETFYQADFETLGYELL